MTYDTPVRLDQYASLIDIIDTACKQYGDKTAYSCFGKNTSFNEIETDSRHFATYLQNNTQLKAGDRIAIVLPNITQFIIAAYGALRAGLVLVNTNPLYTEREFKHQFNDSGVKAVVVLSDLLPVLANLVDATNIETVISTHALDLISPQVQPSTGINNIEFNQVLAQGAKLQFTPVQSQPNDIAMLQYTGGTTGLSKGAMLSHGNIIANAMQTKSRLGSKLVEGEEIFVAPLPIYHIYAFMINLILYFESGACSVLIPNPRDIASLIKTLASYPFTGFAGLNTLFVGLCHQKEFKALDFSHLKITISGGTALTQAAANLWQTTTGCTISEGYGLSETSPVVSLNTPGQERLGTIGKPLIETEVKVIDLNDNEVPVGITGELAVKGPQVMSGYWQKEEETNRAFTQDGYFKTGDIGIASEDGYHTIVDRKKDMVIVSGFNVYPNEIENILSGHNKVLECAVVGVNDDKTGEAVKAVVVLRDLSLMESQDAQKAITKELIDYCREQLTAYKVPKIVQLVKELPKSTVGKVLRRELRNS